MHTGYLHIDIEPLIAACLAIGHDKCILSVQSLHQRLPLHGLKELFPVLGVYTLCHLLLAVTEEMPSAADLRERISALTLTILNKLLRIRIDIIKIRIIPRQGLCDVGIHEAGTYRILVSLLRHGILMLDADHIRNILTHTKYTESSCGIREFNLCGLELTVTSRSIRNILIEHVGLAEGQGDPVILNKMRRRLCIKNLRIRQSYYSGRAFLMGIIRKCLIAGQKYAGLCVLREGHPRHVVQQGGKPVLQFRDLLRILQPVLISILLIIYNKSMQQCGAQHICNGV